MNEELILEEENELEFPEIQDVTPAIEDNIADIMMGRCPPTQTKS